MRIHSKHHENMDAKCIATNLQTGGSTVSVYVKLFRHILGILIQTHRRLNKILSLRIFADEVYLVMLIIYNDIRLENFTRNLFVLNKVIYIFYNIISEYNSCDFDNL